MNPSTAEIISSLRARSSEVLGPLIPSGSRVALVDFPAHGNIGDQAILLGELEYLAGIGANVVYLCSLDSYDRRRLQQRVKDGIILLHGGGNLGDVWPHHQALREQVIADFAGRRIVQLPQTAHFSDESKLRRARDVFGRHPDLVLLARDRRTEAYLRAHFRAEVALCPDSAVHLQPPPAVGAPATDVLVVARTDHESRSGDWSAVAAERGVAVMDWMDQLDDGAAWYRAYRRAARRRLDRMAVAARYPPLATPRQAETWASLSRAHVDRGFEIVRRGRVIVTDRLHVHIFCLLAEIPHVLLDNSYGKVRSFVEAWTGESPLMHWAETPGEALTTARELLARPNRAQTNV